MRKAGVVVFCLALTFFPVAANSGPLEDSFRQGQEAYAAKRYDEAVGHFRNVADLLVKAKANDKAQLVLGNVAVIQMTTEKYADAVETYEKALGLSRKTSSDFLTKAYRNLAVCHTRLGNNALKAAALQKLVQSKVKLPPAELSDIHAQLGDAYRALELYGKAATAYEKANSLLPGDVNPETRGRILTALGLCQGNIGEFKKAEGNLKAAYDLAVVTKQPLTQAEASSNIGILSWERGEYPDAAKQLQAALEIEKTSGLRRNEGVDTNNMGLVLKSVGKYPEAARSFDKAAEIAREVGNKRDEGIAIANRALTSRIQGKLADARRDYEKALALYAEVGFQEGRAGVLMGLGKISETEDMDFAAALARYKEALAIYEKLEMPRGRAEALNQIGRVLRKAAVPQRTTRDLVFEDEEEVTFPPIDVKNAVADSMAAYREALKLAESLGARELVWSARQGLGFGLYQDGKPEEALEEYKKAIALVTAARGSQADVELLGEYMKDKDDLFTEAMEICGALYTKTKKQEYLTLQMQYDETLRNEVAKANMTMVRMEYADPKKQEIYKKILEADAQREKATASMPVSAEAGDSAANEAKAANSLLREERTQAEERVKRLEKTYNSLLAEWKKQYPTDAVMFDSNAKVDTAAIQKQLGPDEALLDYIQLPNELIVIVVTKEKTDIVSVDMPRARLNDYIRNKFIYNGIEKYGHASNASPAMEQTFFNDSVTVLEELYKSLVAPVQSALQGKKRLCVVSSGYLAQLPFGALVSSRENDVPRFLVEDFEISNARLSFINTLSGGRAKKAEKRMLAVGNPRNRMLEKGLPPLDAAEDEVKNAIAALGLPEAEVSQKVDAKYTYEATEDWWKKAVAENSYDILYFATHGMPFSDTYFSYYVDYPRRRPGLLERKKEKIVQTWDAQKAFVEASIPGISHLNGFLYLGNTQDGADGLLTIKELGELPEKYFAQTRYAVLSACNTGVSFAPKSYGDDSVERAFSATEEEKELRKAGWVPGVDQVSFVDAFMRRGLANVYGTLWFADDAASAYLMSHFMEKLRDKDAVAAFSATQREYIAACKAGDSPLGHDYTATPLHPYYWAVGSIFGR